MATSTIDTAALGVSGFEDEEGISEEAQRMSRIASRIRDEVFGRPPRFRYFQRGNGPMFSWTVEPVDGKYASMVHKPKGPGARTDSAERWLMVERLTVVHSKRKAAKARALRLFEKWERTGRIG